MDGFHGLVVEDFDRVDICPEYAPLLVRLVVAAKVWFFLSFVVAVGCVVCERVPLDRAIAVASYIVGVLDGFPSDGCAWKSCHSWGETNVQHFSFIDVVSFSLPIGAPNGHMLIVFVDLHRKDLSVDIPEEIDELGFAVRRILDVDLTGIVLLFDLEVLLMLENVFEAFGSDEFF